MNASDVLNALQSSPGTIGSLSTGGSFSYTPTCNVMLYVTGQMPSGGQISIGGIVVAIGSSTVNFAQVTVPLQKGQTTSIVTTSTSSCLISARSIQ